MKGKLGGSGRQRDGFVAGLRLGSILWQRRAALAGPELAYQSGTASQVAVEIEIVVYIITVKITVATCLLVYVCVL